LPSCGGEHRGHPAAGGSAVGAVEVGEGCTLCLSCVSACPIGALSDDPNRPLLRFTGDACVQCGLCKASCPETVITLVPRLAFNAASAERVLREEEAFRCIRCGKPFGVESTIERILGKLEGRHWMYQSAPRRLDLIKMCEDCRVAAVARESFDPHDVAAPTKGRAQLTIICGSARRKAIPDQRVARWRNSISASRSSREPMRCSSILVPGV
jgi:ferredoxin